MWKQFAFTFFYFVSNKFSLADNNNKVFEFKFAEG
jgi:hypothetical protein